MKKILLLILLLPSFLFSQTIAVQPYLQDAEPQSIKILWETTFGIESIVEWGLTSALGNMNSGTSATGSGSSVIHNVSITGLSPNTRYYYRTKTSVAVSLIFDFITPPLPSSEAQFNFVAMSDMQRDGSQPNKYFEIIHDGVIDFITDDFGGDLPANLGLVIIPGDLVVNGLTYSQWEDHFFDPSHPLFAHVPVYPVPGNHENNSAFFFNYFDLPANGSPGFEEHWWYKDYSNLRIVGLDSNGPYRIAEQTTWLDNLLQNTCADPNIDFVFAQLHHPHKSELWLPGEISFTGDIVTLLEDFTTNCGKPSIHFFGHTHGYSRGQSRDHQHLMVNVATAGGAIDHWGAFPQADYEEFTNSQDEYGFVFVEVEAGASPQFTLKRYTRGDDIQTVDNILQDSITVKLAGSVPDQPLTLFPINQTVSPDCIRLKASPFADIEDGHQATHWQLSTTCGDFTNPLLDNWKQHENWYFENNLQAGDDLTDEEVTNLQANTAYCWRVRFRDKSLKWSTWSAPAPFTTGPSGLSANLLNNPGAESGIGSWTVTTGVLESLIAFECAGISPHSGSQYFAVGALCNESPYAECFQDVDLSSFATDIDMGSALINYGGYLADFNGSDLPELSVSLLDGSSNLLHQTDTFSNQTSNWTLIDQTEGIPSGTRTARLILMGTRNAGIDNDSYFDDLFIRVNTNPAACDTLQAILPVELLTFRGWHETKKNILEWKTTSETNTSVFEIEKSENGTGFHQIGTKETLGNAQSSNVYNFIDKNPFSGYNYYRLKMIDSDGQFEYSRVVAIFAIEDFGISLFPNPTSDNTTLKVKVFEAQNSLKYSIFNSIGDKIYKQISISSAITEIKTNHLSSGIYFLIVEEKSKLVYSTRLLIGG